MRRPSAATAITNQADATRSQQHQHNCFLDIEPSQMVFQGDARNELGPSPRGAIYKRRESYTIVETCFYEKFGTELPRLSILQKTKIEQFSDVLKVLEALISCVLEIRPDVARGKGMRTRFASPSNTSIVRSCHYFQALFGRTPSSCPFPSLFVFSWWRPAQVGG